MTSGKKVAEATVHHNGYTGQFLGPKNLNLDKYGQTNIQVNQRTTLEMAVGSPASLMEHVIPLEDAQGLRTGRAVAAAGVSTPSDLDGLERVARERPQYFWTPRGFPIRRGRVHPNSPVMQRRVLARGMSPGNGGNMSGALRRYQSDVLLQRDLVQLSEDAVNALKDHELAQFDGIVWRGFGGTDVWCDICWRTARGMITPATELEVRLLPAPEEYVNKKNACGILYGMIAANSRMPKSKIIAFKVQRHRGPHPEDKALVAGVGVLRSSISSPMNYDSTNLFALLREKGCGLVEVRPRVVPVPLAHLREEFLFIDRRHRVRLPEEQSPGLRNLLEGVGSLLDLDREALHVIVIMGEFRGEEMYVVKEAVLKKLPGRVYPVMANMRPDVRNNTADYLVTDFVTAPQLPTAVTTLFSDPGTRIARDGLTPEEFLNRVASPVEATEASEIAAQIEGMFHS